MAAPVTPPIINDPQQQADEAERQRLAAEQAAAKAAAGYHEDPDLNAFEEGTGALQQFAGNAVDDFFSAETVNAPGTGSWGAQGTPAAGYNAATFSQGQAIQGAAARQGGDALRAATADQRAAQTEGTRAADLLQGQAGIAGNRAAPTTSYAGADRYSAKGDAARNTAGSYLANAGNSSQQDAQLQALNQFAKGPEGPSAAQAQLQAGSDAAQASALSMARSGRGAGDSASALRDATFSNAATQAQTNQAQAQLRAQEAATHRGQQLQALDSAMGGAGAIRSADTAVTQVAQGTRAQDLQAQQQAAAQQQFKTQAAQQQTSMNDAQRLGLTNAALGYQQDANQTGLGYAQLGAQTDLGYQQLGTGAAIDYAQLGQNALDSQAEYELQQQQMALDAAKANQQADLEKDSGISGMIGAAAGVFGLSDERSKSEIRRLESANEALSSALGGSGAEALDTVGNAPGYSYHYKDPSQPGAKAGRQAGPMAQDLERGPLGDTLVMDTPQGKMVDTGRVAMMTASALTEQQRRLEALERFAGKKAA